MAIAAVLIDRSIARGQARVQLQTGGMLHFHSLPRQQAAARWSAVVSLLDAQLRHEAQVAAATRAACRAFNAFIGAFRKAEVE